ncbi:MAG TPA: hypothetical protein VGE39_03710 [Prosthecobacter sp.]
MSSLIFPYAVGLMAVLALVSWFHYHRTGGKRATDEDPFADAPEWGDERDLGLMQAHPISHAEAGGGEDAD